MPALGVEGMPALGRAGQMAALCQAPWSEAHWTTEGGTCYDVLCCHDEGPMWGLCRPLHAPSEDVPGPWSCPNVTRGFIVNRPPAEHG